MTKNGQKFEFWDATKCNRAKKIGCHLKAFAMVSEKKLQHFDYRAILTFKTTKNDEN